MVPVSFARRRYPRFIWESLLLNGFFRWVRCKDHAHIPVLHITLRVCFKLVWDECKLKDINFRINFEQRMWVTQLQICTDLICLAAQNWLPQFIMYSLCFKVCSSWNVDFIRGDNAWKILRPIRELSLLKRGLLNIVGHPYLIRKSTINYWILCSF